MYMYVPVFSCHDGFVKPYFTFKFHMSAIILNSVSAGFLYSLKHSVDINHVNRVFSFNLIMYHSVYIRLSNK